MENVEPHIHKLKRVKLGHKGYTVYKCMVPRCTTFYRKELVPGVETICWRCGHSMIMTTWHATYAKPHHIECTDTTGGRGAHRRLIGGIHA